MALKIQDISFSYDKRSILKDIAFQVEKGEILALLGPNGTGKSTLLKCMLDLLSNNGTTKIDDIVLKDLTLQEKAKYIAYVPQDLDLVFPITVFDYIKMGVQSTKEKKEKELLVLELIEKFGLEDLALKYITELSGGEKQRVIIARAMAQEPKAILLDEPSSNLDMKHQKRTMEILRDAAHNDGLSIILSIHDINLSTKYCDKFLVLKDSKIFAFGNREGVITKEIIGDVYDTEIEIIDYEDEKIVVLK